jgi:hypothetical protein
MLAAGHGSRPAPWTQTRRSPPRPPHRPPRPRTASAHRRRTGRPPPGHSTPPAVAGPSPRPGSTAAPTAARSSRTDPRTTRTGTAAPAPGRGTGTPTPRARLPHTSGHRQRADPGGGAGGQGSQQVLRVRRQAARESVTTTGRGRITDRTASPELALRLPLLPRTDRAFLTVCRSGVGPRRSARSPLRQVLSGPTVIYGVSPERPSGPPSTWASAASGLACSRSRRQRR